MRRVKYLTAPIEMGLYGEEICDYAESCLGLSIEDLGLSIETVEIESDHSWDAVKQANKKMLDSNKGRTFVEIGVTW